MNVDRELEIVRDAQAVGRRGAELLAAAARDAASAHGSFALAVSGGRTPLAMFAALADEDVPWPRVGIWQVDERIAPSGDPDRNLTGLLESLPESGRERVRPMPVDEPDLERAAEAYAAALPPVFDLVHLGLGDDGHTASLIPGDPVLEVSDRDVAITGEYRGRRRVTLTFPVLDRAERVLWLVTGADKAVPLRRVLEGDRSIPGGRVATPRQVVIADRDAAGDIRST